MSFSVDMYLSSRWGWAELCCGCSISMGGRYLSSLGSRESSEWVLNLNINPFALCMYSK